MRGWRKEARGLSLDREFQERARRHDARRAGRVALRAWLDACGKMDAEQEAKLRYALGEMSARYTRVLVLEDDCFPLQGGIAGGSRTTPSTARAICF